MMRHTPEGGVDETRKKALILRMLDRLASRDRLRQMAAAALAGAPVTVEEVELEQVRFYLDAWVLHQALYRPFLGFPAASSFAPDQSNARTATEYAERSDAWAMAQVDGAVEEDLPALPEGRAMWLALRMRWLNIRVGPRVFRSNRLTHLDPADVDELADRAERALVALLKARKLPLS